MITNKLTNFGLEAIETVYDGLLIPIGKRYVEATRLTPFFVNHHQLIQSDLTL